MPEPFLGEIRMCAFTFPPKGWALCNGQLLPINQNQALFSLLGSLYGGNGSTTFALPNLQGRIPIHAGNGYTLGGRGGTTTHTITMNELPMHWHAAGGAQAQATSSDPGPGVVLGVPGFDLYAAPGSPVPMGGQSLASVGGSQPHNNCQPYLVVCFCIALQGIFPTRS